MQSVDSTAKLISTLESAVARLSNYAQKHRFRFVSAAQSLPFTRAFAEWRCTAPTERLSIIGIERQCLREAGDGLVGTLEAQEREPEIEQRARRIGIDAQRLPD